MSGGQFDYHVLTYMGHVLDEFDSFTEADIAREALVKKVMADELPDFLTADDFDGIGDCRTSFHIEGRFDE